MQWPPAITTSEELLSDSKKFVYQNHNPSLKEAQCDMYVTPLSKLLHKPSVTGAVIPLKQPSSSLAIVIPAILEGEDLPSDKLQNLE